MTLEDAAKIAQIASSAFIALSAIVAFSVFFYTRNVNKRRATLDMVMRTFLDDAASKKYDEFKSLIRKDKAENGEYLLTLLEHSVEKEKHRNALIDQLNSYELVALGIRRKVFDENFYKYWFHRQFTKDFEGVSQYIEAVQLERPSTYCEFQRLYNKWMRKKHRVTAPGLFQRVWWAITNNSKELTRVRDPGEKAKRPNGTGS